MDTENKAVKDALIVMGVEIVSFVVMVAIVKWLMKPDTIRTLKMNAALKVKRVADSQTVVWESVASKAANIYQKARV